MAKGRKVEKVEKVASTVNTRVKRCTCSHDFQDRRYGKGKRLFNKTTGRGNSIGWRCTVCGKDII